MESSWESRAGGDEAAGTGGGNSAPPPGGEGATGANIWCGVGDGDRAPESRLRGEGNGRGIFAAPVGVMRGARFLPGVSAIGLGARGPADTGGRSRLIWYIPGLMRGFGDGDRMVGDAARSWRMDSRKDSDVGRCTPLYICSGTYSLCSLANRGGSLWKLGSGAGGCCC
jgi:hypothetical protein